MIGDALTTLQLISVRWWNASAYYAVSLAEALLCSGYTTFVGGDGKNPPLRRAQERNLPSFNRIDLETRNPVKFFQNLTNLSQFVQMRSISLINAHRPEDHLYGALLKFKFQPQLPLIRTCSDVRPPKKNPLNKWLHQRATDYFIFSCRANLQRYQSVWPIFEDRSAIIYGGIDTNYFRPEAGKSILRRQLKIPPNRILIGIIGRLSPTKGHNTFLKASARVAAKVPDISFLVCGEEVEIKFRDLKNLARRLNIAERVIFLDKQKEVRQVIQCLDIGVVSSDGSEAISRIAMEFMAMGKPQVVTDVNVLPEIIEDGLNGYVVPAGDAETLSYRLLRLIKDGALRRRMGQKARHLAEARFNLSVFAEQTLEIYHKVLQKQGYIGQSYEYEHQHHHHWT